MNDDSILKDLDEHEHVMENDVFSLNHALTKEDEDKKQVEYEPD